MNTVVLYDEKTKEIKAIGYDDTWVLPCGIGVRGYCGDDEPVLLDVGGKLFLKENALITKINCRREE